MWWLDDVRQGVRALRRAPAFTALAAGLLALGIGVTSAMFAVVYGVLLRPLPFHAPEQVVRVWRSTADGGNGNFPAGVFLDLAREARSLQAVAAYFESPVGVATAGEPVRTSAAEVTPAFFDVLGTPAAMGRTFRAGTDGPGSDGVVLGDGAWRELFGGDAAIVGRTVRVEGRPYTVLGVMPRGFAFPEDVRLWRLPTGEVPASPVALEGDPTANRELGYLDVVARLRDGMTEREAGADLRVLATTLAQRYADTDAGESFVVTSVQEATVGDARRSLLVLFAAVGGVLLIACTNLASVLVTRAIARRREFAVRTALGAARRRLVGQVIVEALVVALAGGALGVLVSAWTLDGLLALLPDSVPRLNDVRLDATALLFTFGISALCGLGIGTAPAWASAATDTAHALREGGRAGGSGRQRLRRVLVATQVAMAVVLLAGAGVMLRSVLNLQRVDVGFRSEGVVTQQVVLGQTQYDASAHTRVFTSILGRLQVDPRVRHASIVFPTPLVNNQATATVQLDRPRPGDRPDHEHRIRLGSVGANYFATLGVPFRAGRDYGATDFADTARGIIVNQALARELFGTDAPLERGLRFGDTDEDMYRVIGVVADVVAVSLDLSPQPTAYLPFTHLTLPFMRLVAVGTGQEAATQQALIDAVRAEAPDLPLDPPERLSEIVSSASAEPRFRARLSSAFSLAALTLAALGLYSVVSYLVAARTRDIATRLALGASPRAIWRDVIGEGLWLTAVGLVVGLGATVSLGRLVNGLLFGTTTHDPSVLGALSVVLAGVAVVACYLPARRAMRIDPMLALRAE